MKQIYTAIAITFASAAHAQCDFTPTITPDPLLVCPVGFTQAYTQSGYDSYQWFENGSLILGATNPFIEMDGASIGNYLTVLCTLDGCSELSAPVLVDGWVFLPPTVQTAGDPWLFQGFEGEAYYCPDDTVLLILGLPYDTGIQWTESGNPLPGATNDTLVVTSSGLYSVSGAPSVCPGYMQQLGVTIPIYFLDVTIPQITVVGDQLCIYPSGTSGFQWYLDGAPILTGGECFVPLTPGTYTVTASYANQCGPGTSEPFVVLGIGEQDDASSLLARPNPAADLITIASSSPLNGTWRLLDAAGREALNGRFAGCTACPIALDRMEAGGYMLIIPTSTGERAIRLAVVR